MGGRVEGEADGDLGAGERLRKEGPERASVPASVPRIGRQLGSTLIVRRATVCATAALVWRSCGLRLALAQHRKIICRPFSEIG